MGLLILLDPCVGCRQSGVLTVFYCFSSQSYQPTGGWLFPAQTKGSVLESLAVPAG